VSFLHGNEENLVVSTHLKHFASFCIVYYSITQDTRIELHQSSKFTQTGATWGLDRIDARSGLDGSYRYDSKGDDVTVFIVDSGVLQSHSEFSGRFAGCRDFVGTNCNSPDFHGTHVGKYIAVRSIVSSSIFK